MLTSKIEFDAKDVVQFLFENGINEKLNFHDFVLHYIKVLDADCFWFLHLGTEAE